MGGRGPSGSAQNPWLVPSQAGSDLLPVPSSSSCSSSASVKQYNYCFISCSVNHWRLTSSPVLEHSFLSLFGSSFTNAASSPVSLRILIRGFRGSSCCCFCLAHPRNSLLILVSSVGAFPRSPSSLFEAENVRTRSPGQVGRPHWWAFVWTDQWVSALYILDYYWSLEKDFGGGGNGLSPGVFRNSWLTVIETLFRVYLRETLCSNPIPPRTAWVSLFVFLSLCFPICEMERILAAGWLSQPLWSLKHQRTPRCDVPCFSDHLSQAEVRQDCRAPQASARLSQRQGLHLCFVLCLGAQLPPRHPCHPHPLGLSQGQTVVPPNCNLPHLHVVFSLAFPEPKHPRCQGN